MPRIGSGKAYDGSMRHTHRHRPRGPRRALADDPFVALLDVVAQPVVGFAIHDAVAPPRARPALLRSRIVDAEILERHDLLDEDVPAGNQDDLPGDQAREEEHRPVANRCDRPVCLDLLVGDDRRGEAASARRTPSRARTSCARSTRCRDRATAAFVHAARTARRSSRTPRRARCPRADSDSHCRTAAAAAATALSRAAAAETADDRRPTWSRSPRTRAPPTRCRRPPRSSGSR